MIKKVSEEIYLDNSATTKPFAEVNEEVSLIEEKYWGNPSSLHHKGIDAERILREVKKEIALPLKVKEDTIYFTSGGTEANNWAIWGTALKYGQKKHLITTSIEHSSVLEAFLRLQKRGWEVDYLKVDEEGLVDPQDLKRLLRPTTVLVSIMFINNETGTIQNIKELASIVHQNSSAVFHCDAVQAFGKLKILPLEEGIDLISLSGHKMHAPKGIGALYIDPKVTLEPLLVGGEQEKGLRAGTQNVAGAAGWRKALQVSESFKPDEFLSLKKLLIEKLEQKIDGFCINGPKKGGAPHILNLSFKGIPSGETLVHALEERGVFVSTGSACHSRHKRSSHVLEAMGIKEERLQGAIRISFSYLNQKEEIEKAVAILAEVTEDLRRLYL